MVFSTDKFMSELRKRLDMIANDFEGDMVGDGIINAERMIHDNQFGDPDKVFEAMQEIGTLAEMITNMHHDCDALANAFEDNDLYDFDEQVRRFLNFGDLDPLEYTVEPKIDGISAFRL